VADVLDVPLVIEDGLGEWLNASWFGTSGGAVVGGWARSRRDPVWLCFPVPLALGSG